MATVTDTPQNNGRPTSQPRPMVAIRPSAFAFTADDVAERMWHRQLPAWVISGAIHMTMMGAFLAYHYFSPALQAVPPENQIVETKLEDTNAEKQDFENTDVGLDPTKQTNYNNDRIENVSVPGIVRPEEPVGIVGAPEGPPQTHSTAARLWHRAGRRHHQPGSRRWDP